MEIRLATCERASVRSHTFGSDCDPAPMVVLRELQERIQKQIATTRARLAEFFEVCVCVCVCGWVCVSLAEGCPVAALRSLPPAGRVVTPRRGPLSCGGGAGWVALEGGVVVRCGFVLWASRMPVVGVTCCFPPSEFFVTPLAPPPPHSPFPAPGL